jgi:hypothetical protein
LEATAPLKAQSSKAVKCSDVHRLETCSVLQVVVAAATPTPIIAMKLSNRPQEIHRKAALLWLFFGIVEQLASGHSEDAKAVQEARAVLM